MLAIFGASSASAAPTLYCADSTASNYESHSGADEFVSAPWLCTYLVYGCSDPLADNHDADIDVSVATMCMFAGTRAAPLPTLAAPSIPPAVSSARPFLRRVQRHRRHQL